jgi:hypothetical protein
MEDALLSTKQELLMKPLGEFYKKSNRIQNIIPILNGTHPISLRIIDWFVTNYSKKYNVTYTVTKGDKLEQFIVYLNYKNQLKAYSKKQFDPFCRRARIKYIYDVDKYVVTTVGQLNFFRWALENDVINYIDENLEEIETDMNKNIRKNYNKSKTKKKSKKNTTSSKRRKRRELSVSATKCINKHQHAVTLDFN